MAAAGAAGGAPKGKGRPALTRAELGVDTDAKQVFETKTTEDGEMFETEAGQQLLGPDPGAVTDLWGKVGERGGRPGGWQGAPGGRAELEKKSDGGYGMPPLKPAPASAPEGSIVSDPLDAQAAFAQFADAMPDVAAGAQLVAESIAQTVDAAGVEAELAALSREVARLQQWDAPQLDPPFDTRPAAYLSDDARDQIERKLAALEAVVGGTSEERTTEHSLCNSVSRAKERLDPLDPAALEAMRRRLELVEEAMRKVVEKSGRFHDSSAKKTERWVQEREEMVVKPFDGLAEQLPGIAERLLTLRNLHDDAGSVQREVRAAAAAGAAADDALAEAQATVDALRARVGDDQRSFAASTRALGGRMERLTAALARLEAAPG